MRACGLALGLFLSLGSLQAFALAAPQASTEADNSNRTYQIYRPQGLDKQKPVALVIVLHGGFGSGAQAEQSYNWDQKADQEGFVVVYPDGVEHTWNAGGTCCGPAARKQIDDVGFLTQLIQSSISAQNIDPKRVYITGMSNGAVMAYRYACEGKFPVAAIASVSGDMTVSCSEPKPISVLEIHGLADHNIPIDGGRGSKGVSEVNWPPVQKGLNIFLKAEACQTSPVQQQGAVRRVNAICQKGRAVDLITIAGAGHQWPGSKLRTGLFSHLFFSPDPPSTALDATSVLWEFFQKNALP